MKMKKKKVESGELIASYAPVQRKTKRQRSFILILLFSLMGGLVLGGSVVEWVLESRIFLRRIVGGGRSKRNIPMLHVTSLM